MSARSRTGKSVAAGWRIPLPLGAIARAAGRLVALGRVPRGGPSAPAPQARTTPAREGDVLRRNTCLALLLGGALMSLAPHLPRLPMWLIGLVAALLGWRVWLAVRAERLPRKPLLFALVAAGTFAVYVQHGTIFGRDAGMTLLVLFLGLKLLETRFARDAVVVAFLCLFLVLGNFFYSQSIITSVFSAATTLILIGAMVSFNAPHLSPQRCVRVGGTLILQGLPIALVLFVLFPRLDGPIWGWSQLGEAGQTGLSERMTPGALSQLSQSAAIAFRVRFEGDPPPKQALYWRGPVMWDFDGRTWHAANTAGTRRHEIEGSDPRTRYEVTLEPHHRRWLFLLDLPALVPPIAEATADYQILARRPVRTRLRYHAESHLRYRATAGAGPDERRAALALPEGFNPRTVELARGWRNELRSDRRIIERAVEFLGSQGLAYTLLPARLGRHTADEFLFDTKQGFCEHFSSAFVIMMRAASIPARVVTGYQGGDLNPIDGYLVVRQSDAHAWVEVWLEEEGWVRIDPTAIAAPVRVEAGLGAALPASEPLSLMLRPGWRALAALRYNWEAMTNYWNQWILGYNTERQRSLMLSLGMNSPSLDSLLRALIFGVGIALLVVTLLMLRQRVPVDPLQRAWLAFCRKLERAGVPRRASEGPLDYAERVASRHPQAASEVRAIAERYAELRYGARANASALTELRRAVKRLRIPPSTSRADAGPSNPPARAPLSDPSA